MEKSLKTLTDKHELLIAKRKEIEVKLKNPKLTLTERTELTEQKESYINKIRGLEKDIKLLNRRSIKIEGVRDFLIIGGIIVIIILCVLKCN